LQPAIGAPPRPCLRRACGFDLYRLNAPAEALELGIEEAFADGITLTEWPERLGPLLPAERLELRLEPGARPAQRIATLTPSPGWLQRG
jgi:tRNA threonylcarbamoyladenosine biosynthesis protein TsaE